MISATDCLDSTEKLTDARASYAAAADLLDGYVYEARFSRDDESPDNYVVWASEGFAAVLGVSIEEYNRPRVWSKFYHQDELRAAADRAKALRRGEIVSAEIRVFHATGEVRWLYVKNRPVFDAGTRRVVGFLGIGQDVTPRKEAEANLRALELEITEVSNREQQRIASDLHDGLGQNLTGISMMLRSIADRQVRGFTDLAASLEEVIVLVNRSINEARTLASGLAPLDIGHDGLAGALRALAVHTGEISAVDIRFVRAGTSLPINLSSAAENHIYRIGREAVYNALRHSGAKSIRIYLRPGRAGLLLRVCDDGCGFPAAPSPAAGIGMRMMDYRARTIDARLLIRSRRLVGTSIVCFIPTLPGSVAIRSV